MPTTFDIFESARTGKTLTGETPLADLPRLASLLSSTEGVLAWQADLRRAPRADGGADDFMHLGLHGSVQLGCVRCLRPLTTRLEVERDYRIVASEDEAERQDLEDARYDVIAGSRRFNLGELIEDEAIMALPALPRHEVCEMPAGARAEPEAQLEQPKPLAALAKLRSGAKH